jgi:cobalt-zinc-cadmium efflux system outer membrane protein
MKKYRVVFCFLFVANVGFTQIRDSLRLTPTQVEDLFIQQNLELLAERLNIDIADATIAQARLWNNPELSIGDVNFWSGNEYPRDGFRNAGRNTQFSIELSQMIQMGGTRRRLIRMEETSRDIAIAEFEDILRNLRLDLQTSVNELIFAQDFSVILDRERDIMASVVVSH